MKSTVADILKTLTKASPDGNVMLLTDGGLTDVECVAASPDGGVVIIRGRGTRHSKQFTVAEDGLIGGLDAMQIPDEAIAELLGRTKDSIKKRKKSLGLS
jgi:hypothetical protein